MENSEGKHGRASLCGFRNMLQAPSISVICLLKCTVESCVLLAGNVTGFALGISLLPTFHRKLPDTGRNHPVLSLRINCPLGFESHVSPAKDFSICLVLQKTMSGMLWCPGHKLCVLSMLAETQIDVPPSALLSGLTWSPGKQAHAGTHICDRRSCHLPWHSPPVLQCVTQSLSPFVPLSSPL